MGPPVLPAPSVSPTRQVAHSPQPPPVLDAHSYLGAPQSSGRMATPNAHVPLPSAHVGPPVDYMSAAFVSPTKGAARLPQPSPYNYVLPDHLTTHVGPPTNLHPSYPLPELAMAVDHPYLVNNNGYYSRNPTPHNDLTTITPPRVNSRQSTPNPNPQAHTGALVTPPRQTSRLPYRSARTPLRTAAERNTSSVQYLGDIPANQPPHQHVPSPTTGPIKRGYDDIEDGGFYGDEHEEIDDASPNTQFMLLLCSLSYFSWTLSRTPQEGRSDSSIWAQNLKNAGTILQTNRPSSTSHSAAKTSAPGS